MKLDDAPPRRRVEGMGSHHSARAETDVWLTPLSIIQSLGSFDLDPCSPILRPWDTARKHYTILDNGLAHEWQGRVWLNPPYGRETWKWLARLKAHGNGIALIFARTETDAWFSHIWGKADAILFMRGRINFCLPDGRQSSKNCGAPLALIAYGSSNVQALRESSIEGYIVT